MANKRKASPADIDSKRKFIRAYFKQRRSQLNRAKKLIRQDEYLFEGVLVLCCHIASYAVLRFPLLSKRSDRHAFKEVVLKYSGKRSLYEKIDLLFLYQWKRSHFRRENAYRRFKNYVDVKKILVSRFGDENAIRDRKRYVTKSAILTNVLGKRISGIDKQNVTRSLPLFSAVEQLYRYLRSFAVHNFQFPFLNRQGDKYVANHMITPDVLFETARNILNNLERECLREARFPWQLRQIRK